MSKTVVLRYDDYGAYGDTDTDHLFLDEVEKRGLRCVLGIIPLHAKDFLNPEGSGFLPLPYDKIEKVGRLVGCGAVVPALHGLTHRTTRPPPVRTEFKWVDEDQQIKRIRMGKMLLENWLGVSVDGFIPPWNTCDDTTLRVLRDLEFRWVSGDRRIRSNDPRSIPFTCVPWGNLGNYPSLKNDLPSPSPTVCVVHNHDVNRAESFAEFFNLLGKP